MSHVSAPILALLCVPFAHRGVQDTVTAQERRAAAAIAEATALRAAADAREHARATSAAEAAALAVAAAHRERLFGELVDALAAAERTNAVVVGDLERAKAAAEAQRAAAVTAAEQQKEAAALAARLAQVPSPSLLPAWVLRTCSLPPLSLSPVIPDPFHLRHRNRTRSTAAPSHSATTRSVTRVRPARQHSTVVPSPFCRRPPRL